LLHNTATIYRHQHSVNVRLGEAIAAIGAETGGRLVIELFPNNQFGSDSDMLGQLRTGALEMATMPGTVLSTLITATSLTGVGLAFTGYDAVWPAMDGAVGNYIRAAIAKTNLVPFERTWDNGFRQITSGTRQIKAPEDLRNFKIRIPMVPLWVSMFAAFSATDQNSRWSGEPVGVDRRDEVLGSAEILRPDQSCLGRLLVARRPTSVGRHSGRDAGGDAEAFQCRRGAATKR